MSDFFQESWHHGPDRKHLMLPDPVKSAILQAVQLSPDQQGQFLRVTRLQRHQLVVWQRHLQVAEVPADPAAKVAAAEEALRQLVTVVAPEGPVRFHTIVTATRELLRKVIQAGNGQVDADIEEEPAPIERAPLSSDAVAEASDAPQEPEEQDNADLDTGGPGQEPPEAKRTKRYSPDEKAAIVALADHTDARVHGLGMGLVGTLHIPKKLSKWRMLNAKPERSLSQHLRALQNLCKKELEGEKRERIGLLIATLQQAQEALATHVSRPAPSAGHRLNTPANYPPMDLSDEVPRPIIAAVPQSNGDRQRRLLEFAATANIHASSYKLLPELLQFHLMDRIRPLCRNLAGTYRCNPDTLLQEVPAIIEQALGMYEFGKSGELMAYLRQSIADVLEEIAKEKA